MPEQLPESPPERVGLTPGRPAMTRRRPFVRGQSGNLAGRPPGSRNRTTIAAQALLDGEAEALSRKAAELALGGDINALRLCLDRILPPRREEPIEFEIREIGSLFDAINAVADLVAAVAAGKITLSTAMELAKLIEMYIKANAASDRSEESFARRIRR